MAISVLNICTDMSCIIIDRFIEEVCYTLYLSNGSVPYPVIIVGKSLQQILDSISIQRSYIDRKAEGQKEPVPVESALCYMFSSDSFGNVL